jgi:hypothetical protein
MTRFQKIRKEFGLVEFEASGMDSLGKLRVFADEIGFDSSRPVSLFDQISDSRLDSPGKQFIFVESFVFGEDRIDIRRKESLSSQRIFHVPYRLRSGQAGIREAADFGGIAMVRVEPRHNLGDGSGISRLPVEFFQEPGSGNAVLAGIPKRIGKEPVRIVGGHRGEFWFHMQ